MFKTPLLTFAIALVVLTAPFLAAAQTTTTSNMQTEIQSLLVRIQDLQSQISALLSASGSVTPGTAAMPCFAFSRSLSLGARGADVSALQQFLVGRGNSIPAGATGYFGAQTKIALANWQASNNVAASTDVGSGMFGPKSRAAFTHWCSVGGAPTPAPSVYSFSADPESGRSPLAVTFTSSAPISNGSSTFSIDFGDKSDVTPMTPGSCIAVTAIVGGQGGIRCSASVEHTYTAAGTYTARLIHNTCPEGAQCFVGPLTVATKVITVTASTTVVKDIVQINAPGTTTLSLNSTAEIRNEHAYFKLTGLTATTATIQVTPVGCWNWFPSDKPAEVVCMMYVEPIPPVTLTVGQSYTASNYRITVTAVEHTTATFSVAIQSTL